MPGPSMFPARMSDRIYCAVLRVLQAVGWPSLWIAAATWSVAIIGPFIRVRPRGFWLAGALVLALPVAIYVVGCVVVGSLRAMERRG